MFSWAGTTLRNSADPELAQLGRAVGAKVREQSQRRRVQWAVFDQLKQEIEVQTAFGPKWLPQVLREIDPTDEETLTRCRRHAIQQARTQAEKIARGVDDDTLALIAWAGWQAKKRGEDAPAIATKRADGTWQIGPSKPAWWKPRPKPAAPKITLKVAGKAANALFHEAAELAKARVQAWLNTKLEKVTALQSKLASARAEARDLTFGDLLDLATAPLDAALDALGPERTDAVDPQMREILDRLEAVEQNAATKTDVAALKGDLAALDARIDELAAPAELPGDEWKRQQPQVPSYAPPADEAAEEEAAAAAAADATPQITPPTPASTAPDTPNKSEMTRTKRKFGGKATAPTGTAKTDLRKAQADAIAQAKRLAAQQKAAGVPKRSIPATPKPAAPAPQPAREQYEEPDEPKRQGPDMA